MRIQFYGFELSRCDAGLNYFQSVTPSLALGGEAFYLGLQRKCGIGLAGRYSTPQSITTFQVASTKLVSLSYAQKVSEKVSLSLREPYTKAKSLYTCTPVHGFK